MKCQHTGCNRELVVDCIPSIVVEFVEEENIQDPEEIKEIVDPMIQYYCPEHAPEYGYCYKCGTYCPESSSRAGEPFGDCPNHQSKAVEFSETVLG